jgi:ATP-dependent RNA helicase DDX21
MSRPIQQLLLAVTVVGFWTPPSTMPAVHVHGFSNILLPRGRTVAPWSAKLDLHASASSSTSSSSISSLKSLESMTVPELRQVLKESTVQVERGLLSRLKRKQDLIDYLKEHIATNEEEDMEVNDENDDDDNDNYNEEINVPASAPDEHVVSNVSSDDEVDIYRAMVMSLSKEPQDDLTEHDETTNDEIDDDGDDDDDDEIERDLPEGSPEKHRNSGNHGTEETTPTMPASLLQISSELAQCIPPVLAEKMVQKGMTSLLPIQVASFSRIYSGQDVVLQAPTGSGKTLAFVLPLLAKALGHKSSSNTKTNTTAWRRQKIASPAIVVITPSRELTRQVGKEWQKFTTKECSVVTVFGGVPLERHVSMLSKSKPRVVVGTPGRLRELVREGHLDYAQVTTLVVDEADTLLDKSDSPDVRAILENIETACLEREDDPEYQLVLVSATINDNVVEFAQELELSDDAFIRVKGSESKVLVSQSSLADPVVGGSVGAPSKTNVPTVQHWHMACKSSACPLIATDLISILSPRLTLIFLPTKTETESVASFLSSTIISSNIRILHGDMAQSARSRNIALTREAAEAGASQVLVCTDVASRGLDLPNVDLVIQFGVPKLAGKEGTYSTELYTHRSGRTGRVRSAHLQGGSIETANAIMLYDPAVGEGKLVPELVREVHDELGISMLPKPIPSAAEVVQAAYKRMSSTLGFGRDTDSGELALHFRSKLEAEEGVDTSDPQQLLDYLARAMVALSNLDSSASPFHQHCSLLSGSDADRTLRLYRNDGELLTPPEVTKFCKSIGSGKLGRVMICKDGSAIFDLNTKRANKLVQAVEDESAASDWTLELPLTLPEV